MEKTILFTFIFFLYSIENFGQSSSKGSVEKMELFKTESIIVRNIFHSFSDSCIKIFKCSAPKKLSVTPSMNFDSNGVIYVRPILLIDKDYIKESKKLGDVILLVDSITLIVDKKILLKSCLGDSIKYIGEMEFLVDYGQFEYCLIKQNKFINLKLNCSKGKQLSLNNFSYINIPRVYDEGVPRWYLFWKKKKKK